MTPPWPTNATSPPLSPAQRIRKLLALVPRGKVVSYGQLADLAGLPGRARLVGHTLRNLDTRNPDSPNQDSHSQDIYNQETQALPWHRVVASDGRISLPKGSPGWHEQRQRLLAEGITFKGNAISGNCVDMKQHQWQPDLGEILMLFDF